jgi:DNA-binding transcriptional regulator YiaG
MGKMETLLKDEIRRLAKRQVNAATKPLRKQVRELKGKVRELERTVDELDREAERRRRARLEESVRLEASDEEVEAARINARWVKNLRSRLNISQAELARILDLSVSAVRTWEYGVSLPQGENREKLVALRKLGRRDVGRLLEQQD